MDKQKQSLFRKEDDSGSKPLLGQLWDIVITLMIVYFVVSFLNSIVRNYLTEQASKRHETDKDR